MNFIAAVVAGVVGTFAMFAFILVSPLVVGVPKINIYDYMGTLFTKDPKLSRIIAFALATGTLWSVTMMPFSLESLIIMIPTWLPLIALFVVNQMALSRVINRSKRKSLKEVEAQMAALRPRGDPPDFETMWTLTQLWDYHDRIKGTRNTTLNIGGIMNLLNTLLIPLLAFLLANRKAIFELLGWSR